MNIHRRATIRPPVEVWRLYKSSTQDRAKLFYDPGIIAVGYDVVLANHLLRESFHNLLR